MLQLRQPGDENIDPQGLHRPAGCENPDPTDWLVVDWLKLMEMERCDSFRSGYRRGPARTRRR